MLLETFPQGVRQIRLQRPSNTRSTSHESRVEALTGELRWHDYPDHPDGTEHSVVGTVKVLRGLPSPRLRNRRDILVYLPPSYGAGTARYPVLYMHDGQNLFDRATSYAGEWEVDTTMEQASREGLEAIVVGIPNIGAGRLDEYSPFPDRRHGGGRGNRYLRFITRTLKPLIDRDFRTLPDRANTGIAGSSMGGLISLYAFFRFPQTFGFAGVMSPALWFAGRRIFRYVERVPYVPGRIYLDVGTLEGPGELRDVERMYRLLQRKGYGPGELLYVVETGAGHSEAAWARRFGPELRFLLGFNAGRGAGRG